MPVADRFHLVDIAHDESLPYTSEWVDARFHQNHTFDVSEVGSITACAVRIEARLNKNADGVTVLGGTGTTPLSVAAAGPTMLQMVEGPYYQVRAVVTSITGTGQLHVHYMANQ